MAFSSDTAGIILEHSAQEELEALLQPCARRSPEGGRRGSASGKSTARASAAGSRGCTAKLGDGHPTAYAHPPSTAIRHAPTFANMTHSAQPIGVTQVPAPPAPPYRHRHRPQRMISLPQCAAGTSRTRKAEHEAQRPAGAHGIKTEPAAEIASGATTGGKRGQDGGTATGAAMPILDDRILRSSRGRPFYKSRKTGKFLRAIQCTATHCNNTRPPCNFSIRDPEADNHSGHLCSYCRQELEWKRAQQHNSQNDPDDP